MIASVAKNGKLLECCSPRLQNMLAIVRLAIAQEGRLLKFASLRLRQNHAVILQATKQNPTAIKFAESLSGPLIQSLTEYFGGISRMPRAVVSKLLLHFGLDAIAPKVSTLRSRLERYIIQLKTTNRSVCDLSVQIISTEKARSAGTILHRYGGLGDVLITLQRAMSNGPLTKFGEGDCQKCGHPPSRQKYGQTLLVMMICEGCDLGWHRGCLPEKLETWCCPSCKSRGFKTSLRTNRFSKQSAEHRKHGLCKRTIRQPKKARLCIDLT